MTRRDCGTVIKEMMGHIPDSKIDFIEALEWNLDDSSFKAPEETIQWERTMQTLVEHIPKPDEDWEFEVLSVFSLRPVEDIREAF